MHSQAPSVLSLGVGFLSVSVVVLTRATFCVVLFCVIVSWLFLIGCHVPLQVIDWKDSSPK